MRACAGVCDWGQGGVGVGGGGGGGCERVTSKIIRFRKENRYQQFRLSIEWVWKCDSARVKTVKSWDVWRIHLDMVIAQSCFCCCSFVLFWVDFFVFLFCFA